VAVFVLVVEGLPDADADVEADAEGLPVTVLTKVALLVPTDDHDGDADTEIVADFVATELQEADPVAVAVADPVYVLYPV